MTSASAPSFNPGKGPGSAVGIALLGFGTVGTEVMRLMTEYGDELAHRIGGPLEVRGIAVSDISKPREGVAPELLTEDAFALIEREDVDIVVEVIGGIEYPREVVLAALKAGKSVVTANKALVAAHSAELADAAEAANVDLYFEAAVAGAIPVVGPLRRSLAGDQIQSVMGIVNGTTNFILDAMDSTGADYADSLAEATRLGYAEADPTADVEAMTPHPRLQFWHPSLSTPVLPRMMCTAKVSATSALPTLRQHSRQATPSSCWPSVRSSPTRKESRLFLLACTRLYYLCPTHWRR